jgi:hypothetical protein
MTEIERCLILVEGDTPSNYSAWSPDVPGCVATGEGVPPPTGPGIYVKQPEAA